MAFQLPELNFEYDALEPFMDAKTVEVHHDKHHATYLAKLNAALEKHPDFFDLDIIDILKELSTVPDDIRGAVRNHGGGYYHHNLWWEQIGPNKGGIPDGDLAKAIDSKFGNFESFKKELSETSIGVFGSGWGWLCRNSAGDLIISTTPNQDSPVSNGLFPILTIDVWEHAYYLKYQNRRPEFVDNFWNLVDWEIVAKRYMKF